MKLKLIVALLLICSTVEAQTNTTTVTPGQLKAAEAMLVASQAEANFKSSITTMFKQVSNTMPEDKRAKFMDVMNQFTTKYISWEGIKDQLAAAYAQEFTEKDLKELAAFYLSPLGKKLGEKQPAIMAKSALLGQQAMQGHQAELTQMMEAAFKE